MCLVTHLNACRAALALWGTLTWLEVRLCASREGDRWCRDAQPNLQLEAAPHAMTALVCLLRVALDPREVRCCLLRATHTLACVTASSAHLQSQTTLQPAICR